MFSRLMVPLFLLTFFVVNATEVAQKPAAVTPAKVEVLGVITEDEFAKITDILKTVIAASKIGDGKSYTAAVQQTIDLTNKVAVGPESWTANDFTVKAANWRRYISVIKDSKAAVALNASNLSRGNLRSFYDATCIYVGDAKDVQEFTKRWQQQAALVTDTMPKDMEPINWELLRRKELLAFMNDHLNLYPDAAARITLLNQLAAAGVRSKATKELQAEMSDTPVKPDDPKDNPKDRNKRKLRQN